MSKRPGMLDPLRLRVRRLQLIIGAGILSVILGAVFSPVIMLRLAERMSGPSTVGLILFTVVGQLWVWAILPLILYGFARIIDLKPWTTAAGAAFTGLLFVLALGFVTRGVESVTDEDPVRIATMLATTAVGVVLGRWAILNARAAAARAEEQAKKVAEARKDEYAEFIREAERVAALKEGTSEAERPAAEAPASQEPAATSDAPGAPSSSEQRNPPE